MDLPEGEYKYRGIGVNIVGWHMVEISEIVLDCDDVDCDHDYEEECYYWEHDWIVTDFLEVVWRGDDQVHLVELDELTKLEDDESICSCGQINCWE